MTSSLITIGIDNREQVPWLFSGYPVETIQCTLPDGDYTILQPDFSGRIVIERKSGQDLYGVMTTGRDRFERSQERRKKYEFSAVICENSEQDLLSGMYGRMTPKSIKATLVAWMTRFPTHWIFCPTRAWAEKTAFLILERFARDVRDGKRPTAGEVT